ncbi:unnamed protein product [Prorocentrum cordatum]|uniref:Pre-mRNA-splicing factor SLU7 n=1 Tax=Prorocentrum cordatum TaxID=2364126 RepID=A0ABN9R3Y2_9DINO|nr:unnamed protein product [Polarella glacialis]
MPAAGALVSFDAQLAKRQQDELQRYNGTRAVSHYAGPKVKWEDTGLYKAMVKSQEIEEELVKIRNLIRKRTDLFYEEGDDDFGAAPARQFDVKAGILAGRAVAAEEK